MSKEEVLDQIAADFEYEGWTVRRTDNGALVLERDDDAYQVEVRHAQSAS